MWTVCTGFLLSCLQALIEHDISSPFNGPLEAVYIGLYQAPTTPINQNSVLADITEANYDGYARQEVVWSAPFIDLVGPYTLQGASMFFSPSGSVTPNTITGVFMATALTVGNLLMAQALPGQGRVLDGSASAFTFVPQFSLPFIQIYGAGQVVA